MSAAVTTGRVWPAKAALRLGLIDAIESFEDTLRSISVSVSN